MIRWILVFCLVFSCWFGDGWVCSCMAEEKKPAEQTTAGPSPGEVWQEPVTGMEFVWVPGGCYQMGSPSSESERDPDEGPMHEICVDGFWIGKHEVTNAQYRKWRSAHDSGSYEGHPLDGPRMPVVEVSWNDARDFAGWLTTKSGSGKRFRLPAEAEWEYACRAGSNSARFWGDDASSACSYANVADETFKRQWSVWTVHDCIDEHAVAAPVGSYRPNGFGLYDMLGNVWEWCEDAYDGDGYKKHQRNNPVYTGDGSDRVLRGGSWGLLPKGVRCAVRDYDSPGNSGVDLGFRLVMEK